MINSLSVVTVDLSVNLSDQLLNSAIDLAFLVGPTGDPAIHDESLWSAPLFWFASSELGIDDGFQELERLADWTIITYARNTLPYNEISQKFVESSAQIFSSSSLAVCRNLVLEGVGISPLPIDLVDKDIKKGLIHKIETDWHPSDLCFTASYTMKPYKPELETIIRLAQQVAEEYSLNKP